MITKKEAKIVAELIIKMTPQQRLRTRCFVENYIRGDLQ